MPDIVMVHGAFCGGWSFEQFRRPFETAGFTVHAPDLRGHGAAEPEDRVVGVSMRDYAEDIAALCRSLEAPPILLGHSMGGLVAQMASRRAEVQGLVLLAPSPPWGVAGWSVEEAVTAFGVGLLGPFSAGAVEPNRALMRQYTLDRMTREDALPILERLRPESVRATQETLNWWLDPFMTTSLGPGPLSARSLVIAGERDLVHPAQTVRQTASRIGGEYVLMADMSHYLPGEPGWTDVADLVLDWTNAELRQAA